MSIGYSWLGYLLAICAGLSFVTQQAVNANLRVELGSAWWAGFISYLGGTVAMLVMAGILGERWPSAEAIRRSAWMSWSGGFFGAVYIAIAIFLIPKYGAAVVIAAIVAGQMIGSVAFDHFGILGVPIHAVTPQRVAGVAFLMLGMVLVRN
jgi:transporter family-2 protein